ncbi:MAG: C-GCAxxG-C-C family protein [Gaiellaceae bacterium]
MGDAKAVAEAVELFKDGCACSQAVLASVAERLGLERGQALRVSACFAGGMRGGEVCGAVTGAYMALGLAHCGDDCTSGAGRQAAYAEVESFNSAFRDLHGSLLCRELLGCDPSTPEGAQLASERRLFVERCPELVRDAAAILDETLPPL